MSAALLDTFWVRIESAVELGVGAGESSRRCEEGVVVAAADPLPCSSCPCWLARTKWRPSWGRRLLAAALLPVFGLGAWVVGFLGVPEGLEAGKESAARFRLPPLTLLLLLLVLGLEEELDADEEEEVEDEGLWRCPLLLEGLGSLVPVLSDFNPL